MAKIIVEGWRFLPHSFAAVNQFQCLELLKHPRFQLFHRDAAYWNKRWTPTFGLLDKTRETALRNLPAPDENTTPDAILRMACPFNFEPHPRHRTITFATCEFGQLSPEVLAAPLAGNTRPGDVSTIITPSNWSREGLIRSGLPAERIHIVPHGIDPDIFHPPTDDERAALRKAFGWENRFIFLHVSAMTPNKGIPALLGALCQVGRQAPRAHLVLKGLDTLYQSTRSLNESLSSLPPGTHDAIRARVAYTSGSLSFREIANLYKAADAYVAPYLGEGFNLPVLEAAACGLPVICTSGGPTDDFTTDAFRRAIRSRIAISREPGKPETRYLSPDAAHLAELMIDLIDNEDWRAGARLAAPRHVLGHYTWKHCIDKLEPLLLESS